MAQLWHKENNYFLFFTCIDAFRGPLGVLRMSGTYQLYFSLSLSLTHTHTHTVSLVSDCWECAGVFCFFCLFIICWVIWRHLFGRFIVIKFIVIDGEFISVLLLSMPAKNVIIPPQYKKFMIKLLSNHWT